MKKVLSKLTLLSAIFALGMFVTSCGKDDPELFSKVIASPSGLQIDLTWTINGESAGNNYVDIDVVLDDLEQGSGVDGYEESSGSGSGYEYLTLSSDALDGVYHLAPWIYNFEVSDEAFTMSDDIVLTFTIYPVGDDSNPIEVTQKFTSENYSPDEVLAYAKYTITKDGDDYTVKALNKVVEVTSGWAENL